MHDRYHHSGLVVLVVVVHTTLDGDKVIQHWRQHSMLSLLLSVHHHQEVYRAKGKEYPMVTF